MHRSVYEDQHRAWRKRIAWVIGRGHVRPRRTARAYSINPNSRARTLFSSRAGSPLGHACAPMSFTLSAPLNHPHHLPPHPPPLVGSPATFTMELLPIDFPGLSVVYQYQIHRFTNGYARFTKMKD